MKVSEKDIINRIKELRTERGLNFLAFKEATGVDNSTMSKIEKAESGLSYDILIGISSKLKVSMDWLVYGTGEKDIKSGAESSSSDLRDPSPISALEKIAKKQRDLAGEIESFLTIHGETLAKQGNAGAKLQARIQKNSDSIADGRGTVNKAPVKQPKK